MSMPTNNSEEFFIKDFTKRTLEVLQNYHGEYDVTVLINSMLGLLIVPKEQYYKSKHIPNELISVNTLTALQNSIVLNTIDGNINLDNSLHSIIRHLRNSIAHGEMTILGEEPVTTNEPVSINKIVFYDQGSIIDKITKTRHKTKFRIVIEIELIKNLILEFTNGIVQKGIKNEI